MHFVIESAKDRDIEELKKFAKSAFDLDSILMTANELKYTRAIQTKLAEWMLVPSEEFVKLVSADLIGNKRFTPLVREQFTGITRRAFDQLIGERINDRLKGAMTPESITIAEPQQLSALVIDATISNEAQIKTSAEELEGFHTVRAIIRGSVSPKRVTMRDAQSYCAVLLDDNNRKPICRLRFNNIEKLRLGIFNDQREEEQILLDSVDDIHNYAEQLIKTVLSYIAVSDDNRPN